MGKSKSEIDSRTLLLDFAVPNLVGPAAWQYCGVLRQRDATTRKAVAKESLGNSAGTLLSGGVDS
jgi:hypothetical protein